jgi:catechol 2,3-dioxygenase-like lactoylglutathione lyase family enzyme
MGTANSPGISAALDHVGIVVSSLDDAIAWYGSAFGLRVAWRQPPHDVPGAALGIPARSVVRLCTAMLDAGPGRGIELHEYLDPSSEKAVRELQHTGIGHFAMAVDDIELAVEKLAGLGVQFDGEPERVGTGPLIGRKWIYGRDPFGCVVELCQHP